MIQVINILGVGSIRDRELMETVRMAAEELGYPIDIHLISDIDSFLRLGITAIPAMIIGDRVVANGRIPGVSEVKQLLRDQTAAEGVL